MKLLKALKAFLACIIVCIFLCGIVMSAPCTMVASAAVHRDVSNRDVRLLSGRDTYVQAFSDIFRPSDSMIIDSLIPSSDRFSVTDYPLFSDYFSMTDVFTDKIDLTEIDSSIQTSTDSSDDDPSISDNDGTSDVATDTDTSTITYGDTVVFKYGTTYDPDFVPEYDYLKYRFEYKLSSFYPSGDVGFSAQVTPELLEEKGIELEDYLEVMGITEESFASIVAEIGYHSTSIIADRDKVVLSDGITVGDKVYIKNGASDIRYDYAIADRALSYVYKVDEIFENGGAGCAIITPTEESIAANPDIENYCYHLPCESLELYREGEFRKGDKVVLKYGATYDSDFVSLYDDMQYRFEYTVSEYNEDSCSLIAQITPEILDAKGISVEELVNLVDDLASADDYYSSVSVFGYYALHLDANPDSLLPSQGITVGDTVVIYGDAVNLRSGDLISDTAKLGVYTVDEIFGDKTSCAIISPTKETLEENPSLGQIMLHLDCKYLKLYNINGDDIDTETESDILINTDTEPGPVETSVFGDVDLDGEVKMADVVLIQKHIAKLVSLNDKQMVNADVNGVDSINMMDVTTTQKYIAKLITVFPAELMNDSVG